MNFLKKLLGKKHDDEYEALRFHAGDYNQLSKASNEFDGHLTSIRPYSKSKGIEHAENLISVFHDPSVTRSWWKEKFGLSKEPPRYSFEMWFSDGKLRFVVHTPNKDEQEEIQKQIGGLYPNAAISSSNRCMPKIPEKSYITGGEFTLRESKYAPIRAFSGPGEFEEDPYQAITSELVGHQNQAVMFQVVFSPAPEGWTDGHGPRDPSAEAVANGLREGRFVDSYTNPKVVDPTEKDRRTAKHISDLEGTQAFLTTIRYFVFDKQAETTVRHAKGIENVFTSLYQNGEVNQQLVAKRYNGTEAKEKFIEAAHRKLDDNDVFLSKQELAGLAHFPNDSINTSNVDFIKTVVGASAPGESTVKNKNDALSERDDEVYDSDFAEVSEHPPVDPDSDEPLSTYEKAKQVVSSSDDSFYRDSVSPEDYPETSRTAEAKNAHEKAVFLETCASYEEGTLDLEALREDMPSQEVYDELIQMMEDHIEESYLIRAKKLDKARTDSEATNETDWGWSSTSSSTSTSSTELGEADSNGATTDAQSEDEPLPLGDGKDDSHPAVHQEGEESSSEDRTTAESDNFPTIPGKYAVNFVDSNYRQTRSETGKILNMNFTQTGNDGNLYMGEDVRKLFVEDHVDNPDDNIWLGYQSGGNNPMREVGIEKVSWFEHMSMFGTTGKGKSTLQKVLINQIVRKGHGCVVIDPKGDMANELMREIPDSRLDDVIWIEPGSVRHQDRVAAINFLEASVPKSHPRYDREVESIVGDLQAILRAEGYWGAKMAGITKNITRAMVRSENPYTLYDMYNVLAREEKRWNFAKSLEREGVELNETETGSILSDIQQYSRRIAEMDEDEVDPVVRRLQDWAESPISKEIVSHRHSSININDAVEDSKIIMVRNTVANEEVKRVISTAIMRRVWVTIQARSDEYEEEEVEHEPYFAVIDEFDDIVSDDMNIEKMLSKARSGKMSVCLACQNPGQIKKDHEDVLDQIFDNTDTMMTFGVRGPKSSRLIAERFGDKIDKNDIQGLARFRLITRLSYGGENGPERTDPLGLRTFPDYPPLRTKAEADQAIDDSLQRYGVEPMSNHPGETDLLISGGGLQEQTVVDFLEQVWSGHLRSGRERIAVEEVTDDFAEVVGTSLQEFPNGIGVPKELIEVHNVDLESDDDDDPFALNDDFEDEEDRSEKIAYATDKRIHIQDGQAEVSITAKGIDAILQQDSGRSQPTETHREVIHGSFRWFSRLGFNVQVPIQRGSESVCDAQAFLPITNDESKSWKEVLHDLDQFEDEFPIAAAISNTFDLNLEAETTTRRKPARTIENVLRAKRKGKKAILVVEDGRRDGHDRAYHANRVENIMTDPPMYREDRLFPPGIDPNKVDEDNLEPVKILYNRTDKLQIGNPDENQEKFALIPKGKEAVWVDDGTKLKLYDGHGPTANKFGEAKYSETHYGSSNAFEVWARYDSYQREWVVYPGQQRMLRYDTKEELKEDYQFVRGPLYMAEDQPQPEDWSVMILPDAEATYNDPNEKSDDNREKVRYDLDVQFPPEEVPFIYEDGEMRPLIPDEHDLLTPPREDETASADEVDEDGEHRAITEIMDSFEQIQLEEETKELIDGYQRQYTAEEHQRLDEIEEEFGAKNPADIELWMDVWDHWIREYDTGIVAEYLADATMTATGLTRKRAQDAVNIAKEFDFLLEATAVDEGDPRIDEDTEVLRLVLPEERPDLYVEPAKLKEFVDRGLWEDLWTAVQDISEPLKPAYLQTIIEKLTDIDGKSDVEAVVAVGIMCGSIVEEDGLFYLASERPDVIWLTIWEKSEAELESPLHEKEIKLGLSVELLGEDTDHEDYFAEALDHNELYSPDEIGDDQYLINDPASDDGPEIIEREEPDEPDDDLDGVDTTPEDADTADVGPDAHEDVDASSSTDTDAEQDDQTPLSQEAADAATTADSEQPTDGASTDQLDEESAHTVMEDDTYTEADEEYDREDRKEDDSSYNSTGAEKVGGVPDYVVLGEDAPASDEGDRDEDNEDADDELTRFLTYEKPSDLDDDFDVDRDAAQQFVDKFCEVDPDAGKKLKVHKSTVFNAFMQWAEINSIELNDLSSDIWINNRKGNLNQILEKEYDIGVGKYKVDGERAYAFDCIALSDDGQELYELA
ncbi:type IV secretory system conjugative DNA transfer family protein [Halohasta litorea]|uniref:Type IV secretory system conjugative DNA transfer family protein n=1 Tax=Halohasta litorea TaxID=869891 RepID=A0ABD6DDK1_9EURY|nr:type IV secretory system conjugative DNA transfer family protein [Halohasta litorea]